MYGKHWRSVVVGSALLLAGGCASSVARHDRSAVPRRRLSDAHNEVGEIATPVRTRFFEAWSPRPLLTIPDT